MKMLSASRRSRWVSRLLIDLRFARFLRTCHLQRAASALGCSASLGRSPSVTKTRILAAAALAAVLPSSAIAQAAQAPKPVSRADYIRTLDARFNTMDTNHDGKVS